MIEYRSKVFIKGDREGITCSEKTAKEIEFVLKSIYSASDTPLTIKGQTFTKSEIRKIEVRKDFNPDEYNSHWIIFSKKRNFIWKQPYKTFEEAKAELDYQQMSLPEGMNKSDWAIIKQ